MLVSKKVPEKENPHLTVRLQESWFGEKKPVVAKLAADWGQLTTFILQEPRTLLRLDRFAYSCYGQQPLQPMSSPSPFPVQHDSCHKSAMVSFCVSL